jgi:DNA polymerase III subunit delta'
MTATLFGQDRQAAQFRTALDSGKLHHGWILSGPRGVGKAQFSKQAASWIVDSENRHQHLIAQGNYPDIFTLERLVKDPPKDGEQIEPDAERKRSISVDQIRDLQHMLNMRPSMGDRRVIIIDAADDLERSSANALLKSLEEPPPGTYFLLVSHASERLLPTIRSRCQVLRFDPLDENNMRRALTQADQSVSTEEINAVIGVSNGSPGQAMQFMGLDIAAIETHMDALISTGDVSNAIRHQLAEELSLKSAQLRYEAFMRRVPRRIASHARSLSAPNALPALNAFQAAETLGIRALALSLDKQACVFEMGSLLASLQTHKHGAE